MEAKLLLAGAQAVSAQRSEWIVRLTSDVYDAGSPTLAQALAVLNTSQVEFSVAEGLGLPGLILVRLSEGSAEAAAAALAANPRVAYAVPNTAAHGLGQVFPNESQTPAFSNLFALHNTESPTGDIDAPEAWEINTGRRDQVVGVIDTGIDYTHPDLFRNIWINPGEIPLAKFDPAAPNDPGRVRDLDGDGLITFLDLNDPGNAALVTDLNGNGRIDARDLLLDPSWANGANEDGNQLGASDMATPLVDDLVGWDFANNDNDPFDDHGHGTHVAGIIGAEGDNGEGIVGVNWAVSLLPLKFLDANNHGDTADAIQAIAYAASLRRAGAPVRVLNNSWESGEGFNPALFDAVQETADADMLFVAGAGNGDIFRRPNNNDANPVYPASLDVDNVLSVAAVNGQNELVPFYNFGPLSVDLAAPGLTIYSTEPGNAYEFRSGTSFSTAFVSGAAALILASAPDDITTTEVRNSLLRGAAPLAAASLGLIASNSKLNARGALDADAYHPRAALLDEDNVKVEQRNVATVEFEISYTDNRNVLRTSLSADDLLVQPPGGGPALPVELVSPLSGPNADMITARYRVRSPGAVWEVADNGEYEILLQPGTVLDTANPANDARPMTIDADAPQHLGVLTIDVPAVGTLRVTDDGDTPDANPGDGEALDANGKSTLRAAIMEANASPGENTILLNDTTYLLTRAGAGENGALTGDLDITDTTGSLTIVGEGADKTFIDAAGLDRIFHIQPGVTVEIRGVTIQGGAEIEGGGIRSEGALTLRESLVRLNRASFGGGLLSETGDLVVESTEIADNVSDNNGGGVSLVSGDVVIRDSSIVRNLSQHFGGGVISEANLQILNSTLRGNAASLAGLDGGGGGILANGPTVIQDTLIEENVAGTGVIPADPFEPNNSLGAAIERRGGDQSIPFLTLHDAGDEDYFRWTASAAGNLTISALFLHSKGDLSLEVMDTAGNELGRSESNDDDETVTVAVTAGQTIVIRVFAAAATVHPRYELQIDGPPRAGGLTADAFEPNESRSAAINLKGGDQKISDLSIHSGADTDFFRWTAAEGGLLTIDVTFTHSLGDIDVFLRSANGVILARSDDTVDNEHIEFEVERDSVYYVEVFGFGTATNPTYELALDGNEGFSDGGGVSMYFDVPVVIRDSVIRGNSADLGGGVSNFGAMLTIEDTMISQNKAVSSRADPHDFTSYTAGGGIYTEKQTTLRRVEISDNEASVGAGIDVGFNLTDTVEIFDSLIANNTAKQLDYSAGGGIRNGNGFEGGGTMMIHNSTIRDNFSRFEGGGITNGGNLILDRVTVSGNVASVGGGISNWATLTVNSSTISGNHATDQNDSVVFDEAGFIGVPKGEGGGLYNIYLPGFSFYDESVASLLNATIANNTAAVGGAGIVADSSEVQSSNTIIAGNHLLDGISEDIDTKDRVLFFSYPGQFTSQGFNLLGRTVPGSHSTTQSSDRIIGAADPGLSPLQDNGGPTLTHLPLPGSQAIDTGQLAGGVTIDQRGIARPKDGNANGTATADIGAVERYHGEIRGVVFRDLDRDQTRDAGEPGLSKWTVYLDLDGDSELDAGEPTALSDASGQYVFTLVTPGNYVVREILQGLFDQTTSTPMVTVLGGQVVSNVNFGNGADVGAVRGEVFNDQDSDGIKSDREVGLSDWQIFLDADRDGALDAGETVALTDAEGKYEFASLTPGSYRVEQVLKTGWSRTAPLAKQVFDVDFSDSGGAADAEGFVIAGPTSQWRLSMGRGADAGHSADDSFYFGAEETPSGGGSYLVNHAGVLTSPPIDLTHASGAIELTFNHFLDLADDDEVRVRVRTPSGVVALADNGSLGGLANTSGQFQAASVDLSAFAGQVIQVEFEFLSDTVAARKESISTTVLQGSTYYVRVVGPQGSRLGNYDLELDLPDAGPDAFEPNDDFLTAVDLGPIDLFSADNLSIHRVGAADNEDFFEFTPLGTGTIDIRLLFEHARGDIDAFFYNEAHDLVASAVSGSDDEVIRAAVAAGQTYYLRVIGFNNAANPHYDLRIDAPGIGVDRFDVSIPNDSPAAATDLGTITDVAERDLTIHTVGDHDYFLFTPLQSGPVTIDLRFVHNQGDLDLFLLDSGLTKIGLSDSSNDGEQITFNALASESYYIEVTGFGGATSPRYDLSVDSPGEAPDVHGSMNDGFPSAVDVGQSGFIRLSDLTIDTSSDEDFFRFTPTSSGAFELSLLFDGTMGDADLFLYDENQNLIASTVHEGWYLDDVRIQSLGVHDFALEAGQIAADVRFGDQSVLGASGVGQNGVIEGRVFYDTNRNRLQDAGELGLSGVDVWMDYDNNGQRTANETTTTLADDLQTPADEAGVYRFTGLAPGKYTVHLVTPADGEQTFPVENEFTAHESRTGNNPQSVVIANLDGMGRPDVAVANSGGATVTVFLSDAAGAFPTTGMDFEVAPPLSNPTPVFVTAADVNGQNGPDLIVANYQGESVSLLENLGNGAFAAYRFILDLKTISAASGIKNYLPISLTTGYFDNNGTLDVAVALAAPRLQDPGRLAILLNDGMGNFTLAESHAAGVGPESIVRGQFNDDNNDGRIDGADDLDLAIAAYGDPFTAAPGAVSIFLNNLHGVGMARFRAGATLNVPTGGLFGLAAGDLDGNGSDDLAAANSLTKTVTLYLNDGAAAFVPQPAPLAVGVVTSINALDLDGDGDLDLAAANALVGPDGPTVKLFRNRGSADFPATADQTQGIASLQGSNFFSLSGADFNNDLAIDLAVAKANAGVLRVLTGEIVAGSHTVDVANGQTTGGVLFALAFPNEPPTLTQPADLPNLQEEAGLQTVPLAGITAGTGDVQDLAVSASTSDAALITQLAVQYTSPNATGSMQFRPGADRSGVATITVTVRDAGHDGVLNNSDDGLVSRTLTVTVAPQNDPPTLANIANPAPLTEGAGLQTVNFSGVSAGGGETQALRVTAVSDNTALIPNPTVTYASPVTAGSLAFTPASEKSGMARITVTVSDAGLNGIAGDSDDASFSRTFTVTVNEVNDPPTLDAIANPNPISENAPEQTVNFSGVTAGGGESQAVRVIALSGNTSLIPNVMVSYTSPNATGSLRYTPAAGQSGQAEIVVLVNDAGLDGVAGNGDDGLVTQSFTVTVNAVNDPPTLGPINDPQPIAEGVPTQTVNFAGVSAGGGESQALRVTVASSNPGLIPQPTVSYTSPAATGTLSYKPVDDQSGAAVITVTVHDAGLDGVPGNGDDGTVSRSFTVTVQPENDPPTLDSIADVGPLTEDADEQTIDFTGITAGGGESQALRVSVVSSNPALIPHPAVAYASPSTIGSLTFQPIADRSGAAIITVTVSDAGLDGVPGNGDDGSFQRQFVVTVQSENDPPTLDPVPNPPAVPEDTPTLEIDLSGISAGPGENSAVRLTAISNNPSLIPNPAVDYVSPAATGKLVLSPAPERSGAATIIVTVSNAGLDGVLGTADDASLSRSFAVTINPENDPPTLDPLADPTPIDEDGLEQTINVGGISAGGGEVQTLRVTATSSNSELIGDPTVSYTSPEMSAVLTYTPTAQLSGTAVITVTVIDAGVDGLLDTPDDGQSTETFTVTVNAVNDPPALDLNGADEAGLDFATQFSAATGPAALVDLAAAGGFTLDDLDNATLQSATAMLASFPDGAAESLDASPAGTDLTVEYNAATGVLTITGADTVENYARVLATLTYQNNAALPQGETRTVEIRVFDGVDESPVARAVIQLPSQRDRHDVNGDNAVNLADLLAWVQSARQFGLPKSMAELGVIPPPYLDVNLDGAFTINDLVDLVGELRSRITPAGEGEGEAWASTLVVGRQTSGSGSNPPATIEKRLATAPLRFVQPTSRTSRRMVKLEEALDSLAQDIAAVSRNSP